MLGAEDMSFGGDLRYIYDGSFPGFFCCVFESMYTKRLPSVIEREYDAEPSLFEEVRIKTDLKKAKRVRDSVPGRISLRSLDLIEAVFLSCMEEKELAMLRYLLLGYKTGAKIDDMLGHPDVAPLLAAERHLMGEAHLLKGFVRFSDYDGTLAAVITPKNFVLPCIARHFIERYNAENFMIYDKTHGHTLVYGGGVPSIVKMENVSFPEPSGEERQYRDLWKRFYKTIAIEARENPKCRMTHMPRRYWGNMTEFN